MDLLRAFPLLLLASLLAAPAVAAEPAAPPTESAECRFLTVSPFPPFVVIDWDCPPVALANRPHLGEV